MARATRQLTVALRKTITRLLSGEPYQWGHLGACNCGHLAQTLTNLPKGEIHRAALIRDGDWGEVSQEYCETSGLKVDSIIKTMLSAGLDLNDIEHLENLSDRSVLARMGVGPEGLKHNSRADVIAYMTSWVEQLEERLDENPPETPIDVGIATNEKAA